MKKSRFILIFAAIIGTQAGLFGLDGTVSRVTGKAEIQEGSLWVPLKQGDSIYQGCIISTGFNSSLEISINQTKFTLGPLTRITLEELTSDKDTDKTQLYIDSGSVTARVESETGRRSGFKVRSPAATASVRGTVFTVTASGILTVDRGTVSFAPADTKYSDKKGIPVTQGQTSRTDSTTGKQSAPQEEIKKPKFVQVQTESAAAQESITEEIFTETFTFESAAQETKPAQIIMTPSWPE